MKKNVKYSYLPAMLMKSKTLLLAMSLLLIVANISTLVSTRNLAKSSTDQQSQATWFLFQLSKEFSELNAIAPLAAETTSGQEKISLKYDLTWSRFDILINAREADSFMNIDGTKAFFSSLFHRFKALEPFLAKLDDPQHASDFSYDLNEIYLVMVEYMNTNFRLQSPIYSGHMEQVHELYRTQFMLLLLLCLCAGFAGYIIHNEARYHLQIALTDYLTKVKSRLAMFNDLEALIDNKHTFSLLLLDLNGFKQINDKYGHQAGDEALKQVAGRLSQLDMSCYRIGGDEFALVTQSKNVEDAWQQVEACFQQNIEVCEQQTAHLSTSIGIARFPADATQLRQLISIADRNMYKMKFAQKDNSLAS